MIPGLSLFHIYIIRLKLLLEQIYFTLLMASIALKTVLKAIHYVINIEVLLLHF